MKLLWSILGLVSMASKLQRGDSSQSAQAYDRTKFVSSEVSKYFHNVLTWKYFMLEKGLRPDETQDEEMGVMIMEPNWFDLTEQPSATVISVVKEFYANAWETKNYVVQVHGKLVSYARTTINSYYNLRDIDVDDYMYYGSDHYDLDLVIRKLCKPGTTWTLKQNTMEKISFPHGTALSMLI